MCDVCIFNATINVANVAYNAQELDSDFKIKVYDLINQRFEYAFHPAMAIANQSNNIFLYFL